MSEWWRYAPSDFLLFSPRVYFRLLELHNEAVWPAQIVALALGFLILALSLRPIAASGRAIGCVLAAAWIWVAWSFLWQRYATINWAAAYVAPLFVAEGALLLYLALTGDGLAPVSAGGFPRAGAIALLAAAILLYPIAGVLAGRNWQGAEVFGIFPDPTAAATLAMLALAGRGTWPLMLIPLTWCLFSSGVLYLLGAADALVPAAAAAIAVALRLARRPSQI